LPSGHELICGFTCTDYASRGNCDDDWSSFSYCFALALDTAPLTPDAKIKDYCKFSCATCSKRHISPKFYFVQLRLYNTPRFLNNFQNNFSNTGATKYTELQENNLCKPERLVTTEEECKIAATGLNIPYDSSGNWKMSNDFKGCLAARDGRNKVFFNTAFDHSTTVDSMNQDYHAICRKTAGRNISVIEP
jgi:hypothetical protein